MDPPNGSEANLIKDVTVARAMAAAQKTRVFVLMDLAAVFFRPAVKKMAAKRAAKMRNTRT